MTTIYILALNLYQSSATTVTKGAAGGVSFPGTMGSELLITTVRVAEQISTALCRCEFEQRCAIHGGRQYIH